VALSGGIGAVRRGAVEVWGGELAAGRW
jgi:hypothetical protein